MSAPQGGYRAPVVILAGKYRLLEKIGEGGMGIVYMAEQSAPMRRRVAVKIIKHSLETRTVLARFAAEEQALALMNHPNIAKVFDAGVTDDGRAYFVMEHVPGVPITRYCEEHRLPTRERLALFTAVCEAIQHAHQKGVIHRDIKPSNVLVMVDGASATPKVIDFGVAKAISHPLTEQTLYTEQGLFVGTPDYMSPEQAGVSALDIDTRSDVYALGVLLYELVTGVLPFDRAALRQAGLVEMQRIIRETDPPRPSARLSTLGATGQEIAARQHTDVRTLTHALRRDLDWVIMRALEKDRTRRYASASEFAADVERHLADQPVMAGPPSVVYRVVKFARRHRGSVAASAAVFVALVGGLAATSAMYYRLRVANERTAWKGYVACIQAADASLRVHEVKQAKQRLAECEPSLRNWEWRYLSSEVDSSAAVLRGVDRAPIKASFSQGGASVIGISQGEVLEWDQSSLRLTRKVVDARASAISPDGDRILQESRPDSSGAGFPYTIAAGTARQTLSTLEISGFPSRVVASQWVGRIEAAAFDNGRRLIATVGAHLDIDESSLSHPLLSGDQLHRLVGSGDRTIRISEIDSGKLRGTLAGHRDAVWTLAWSPNDRWLASASEDATVRVWNLNRLALSATLVGHASGVVGVAFSADGSRIATGSRDRTVRIWDSASGRMQLTLSGHDDAVMSVAFSPDGKQLASGSADKTVRIWDTSTGQQRRVLHGHESGVVSVSFRPQGDQLLSGSKDGTARLWNVADPSGLEAIVTESWADLLYSQDGKVIAAQALSRIRTWDAATKLVLADIRLGGGPSDEVGGGTGAFAISDDGSRIVAGLRDGKAQIWDARSGRSLAVWELPAARRWTIVAFRPKSGQIAIAAGRRIEVLDPTNLKKVLTVEASEDIEHCTYSPDGTTLAVLEQNVVYGLENKGQTATIRLWDAGTGVALRVLGTAQGGLDELSFSPNGKRLAARYDDGAVIVFDVTKGKPLTELRGHDSSQYGKSVAYSPDGSRILTAASDRTVRLWDSETGEQLLVLRYEKNSPSGAVFTPDGKTVLSWIWGGSEPARIWTAR